MNLLFLCELLAFNIMARKRYPRRNAGIYIYIFMILIVLYYLDISKWFVISSISLDI